MNTVTIDALRRRAKTLQKAYEAGHTTALERVKLQNPRVSGELLRADFLYVIAREEGFESWPKLKLAVETTGLAFAQQLQRLKIALYRGQNSLVERLLTDTPDLADGHFGLQIALLNRSVVAQMLATEPELATRQLGPRRPLLHLAFSRYIHCRPELADDMLAIAELLLSHGADVNDSYQAVAGSDQPLSALYGAIAHADNLVLARWLLEHEADPNDGESLYHSTELGHHDALKMLLEYGANPAGTNALLRAIDFDDSKAVQMLIAAGADVNESVDHVAGSAQPAAIPALHQAARRMSGERIVSLLLENGADLSVKFEGVSAYAYSRVFGNTTLTAAIERAGADVSLTENELLLVSAAENTVNSARFINPATLPEAFRNLIRLILHLPDKLAHVERLVALGMEYDRPDSAGITPVQIAGWEGLPDVLEYLISLKPDLSHVNGYGGTLLSTIIHGATNCPQRAARDYIACLELVLTTGVALPSSTIKETGDGEIHAFLTTWGEKHPGQVVAG